MNASVAFSLLRSKLLLHKEVDEVVDRDGVHRELRVEVRVRLGRKQSLIKVPGSICLIAMKRDGESDVGSIDVLTYHNDRPPARFNLTKK